MISASRRIRDEIFTRLEGMSRFKECRRVIVPQRQPDEMPSCAVYLVSELSRADGDPNAGAPEFMTETVVGISVLRGFDDPEFLDGSSDDDGDDIIELLLTDPTFVRFGRDALFEGVSQITCRRTFQAKDGETYFAELVLELTFEHRSVFEPVIKDDLKSIRITTKPLGKPDAPAITTDIAFPED